LTFESGRARPLPPVKVGGPRPMRPPGSTTYGCHPKILRHDKDPYWGHPQFEVNVGICELTLRAGV